MKARKTMSKKTRLLVLTGGVILSVAMGLVGARIWIDREMPTGDAAVAVPARNMSMSPTHEAKTMNTPAPPRREVMETKTQIAATPRVVASFSRKREIQRRDREEVARLLKITQRLVRAREELLFQKQRLEKAEMAARQARADASRVKFEAMKALFQKKPELALGGLAQSASSPPPPPTAPSANSPWGAASGASSNEPRVKAVQEMSSGDRSALVEADGRIFLVREGQRIGKYRVSRISTEGVEFRSGKKKVFSPLSAFASSPAGGATTFGQQAARTPNPRTEATR